MYSPELWRSWVKLEMQNYKVDKSGKKVYLKKGYRHLDHRIWFPDYHAKVEAIVKSHLKISSLSGSKIQEHHSFSPFLKIITKTPRYRYQFEEGHYELETKERPICFAAHMDSLILGYYSFALTRQYEAYIKKQGFDEVVFAYRSDLGKSNIQFAKEIFDQVKLRKECSTIALDIKGYFDNIDHLILLEKWKAILGGKLPDDQMRLYKILTKYSYIKPTSLLKKYHPKPRRSEQKNERIETYMDIVPGKGLLAKFKQLRRDQLIVVNDTQGPAKRTCGIPQGSPISALLSNIFLIDFDADLKKKSIDEGFIYRRYCDDILLICDTDKAHALMNFVIDKISKEYHLTIQPAKVDLIDFHSNSKGKLRAFRRPRKTKRAIGGGKGLITIRDNPASTKAINEDKFYRSLQYLGFEFNGKDILIRPSSLSRYYWKLNYRLQRTVIMSYSPKSRSSKIYLRQIYERYTHIGNRNFLTYAANAAKRYYENAAGEKLEGMNSPAIKRQLRNHWKILKAEIETKNIKWFSHKLTLKKPVSFNSI